MKNISLFPALALLLSTLAVSAENGNRVMLNGQTEDCSLFQALNGSEAVPEECKESSTRSMFTNQAASPATPVVLERVTFDFDSARLTEDAQVDLARVAKAMRDPVSQRQVYRLDGYTDLQGNPGYNRRLSHRRAESVRRHLINLGVPASRLGAAGHGSENPANPADPYSLVNRRVEVVNLSQGGS